MESTKDNSVEVVKNPNYRNINVNGIIGGYREGYFEAVVYSSEMEVNETLKSNVLDFSKSKIRRVLECRLVIDPMEAKRILRWLNHHLAMYEQGFGKIILPEEKVKDDKNKEHED